MRRVSSQFAIRRLWLVLYNTARVAVQSFCLRSRLLQSILHLHAAAAAPPLLAPRPCGSLICKRVAQQDLFTPVGLLLLQKLQSTRLKKSALE